MAYRDIKRQLEELSNENYKDFIKALVSIEKGIEDENILDEVYDEYMDNDSFSLLSEDFDNILEEIKEQEKIVDDNIDVFTNDNSIEYVLDDTIGLGEKLYNLHIYDYNKVPENLNISNDVILTESEMDQLELDNDNIYSYVDTWTYENYGYTILDDKYAILDDQINAKELVSLGKDNRLFSVCMGGSVGIVEYMIKAKIDSNTIIKALEHFQEIAKSEEELKKLENLSLKLSPRSKQPIQETFYEAFKCKNKTELLNKVLNKDNDVEDLIEYLEYKSKDQIINKIQLTSPDDVVEVISKLPKEKTKINVIFVNTKNNIQLIKNFNLEEYKDLKDLSVDILKERYKGLHRAFFVIDSELDLGRSNELQQNLVDNGLLDIISYKDDNMYYSFAGSKNVYAKLSSEELLLEEKGSKELDNDEFNKYYSQQSNLGLDFINDHEEILSNLKTGYDSLKREEMGIIIYDKNYKIIEQKALFAGGISSTVADPTLILSEVLNMRNSYGFAIYHNHPSGYSQPSVEDVLTTKSIINSAKDIGIKMSDHFVIAKEKVQGLVKADIEKFDKTTIDSKYKQKIIKPELTKNGMEWLLEI